MNTAQKQPPTAPSASPPGRWRQLLAVDPRSLALFRILAGCLLLYDLATRAADFQSMYGPGGVMPVASIAAWNRAGGMPMGWSLYLWSSAAWYQAALFGVAAVFATALLVGYRTRLATIVSWVMLASIQTRAPILVNGGDVLLVCLLFWGMFLPLGGRWSLDVRLGRTERRTEPVLSVPAAAMLLQVFIMYLCTGLSKLNGVWLSGEALQNALSFDVFVRPLGRWLLNFPTLLNVVTRVTLWGELIFPFLLFFPWGNRYTRAAALLFFAALHAGIESTMTVALFSFSSLAGLCLFLTADFWDSRAVRGIVAWFARLLPEPWRRPRELSPPGRLAAYLGNRKLIVARDIACSVLLASVVLWNVAMTSLIRYTGGVQIVQTNLSPQPAAGGESRSPMESGRPFEAGPSGRPGPLLQVCYHYVGFSLPLLQFLHLDQRWDMFSHPPDGDYRFVARAHLRDGSVVDALRGGAAVDLSDVDHVAPAERDVRWMLLYMGLTSLPQRGWFAQDTAEYLRRTWNAAHDESRRVERLELILLQRVPHKPGISSRRTVVEIGRQPGMGILRDAGGNEIAEGTVRYGVKQGDWTHFYPNGQKGASGKYRDGRKEGPWTFWHENGHKSDEGRYAADLKQGAWVHWYANGQKSGEGNYLDDKKNGPWRHWHENGQQLSDGSYRRGVEQGRWTYWYPDGRKEGEGEFQNGKMEGRWIMHDENGATRIVMFRDGRQVDFDFGSG